MMLDAASFTRAQYRMRLIYAHAEFASAGIHDTTGTHFQRSHHAAVASGKQKRII